MATVDINNRDPGGTDPASLVNRLKATLSVQQLVNRRMADIQSTWVNPGPPDAPAVLNDLIAECNRTIQIAQRLNTR
jgi:hypothetical protein